VRNGFGYKGGVMRFSRIAAALVLVGVLVSPAVGGFHPGIEFGIMLSPGYNDYMKSVYENISGGYGWLDLGLNGKIDLTDNLALVPAVDAYLNFIDYGYAGNNTEVNSLIVPALNVRFSFKKAGTFYLQAGPNFNVANGGGDESEFDGGGIGGGGLIGYSFKPGVEVELGYNYIPVDAAPKNWRGVVDGEETTENFGGPFLRVGYKF
jgi:hypothetical protein